MQKMGYGSRALQLLSSYYSGDLVNVREDDDEGKSDPAFTVHKNKVDNLTESQLLTETIRPRKQLNPLLIRLCDRPCERLHYLGWWMMDDVDDG